MNSFFKGKIKIKDLSPKYERAELGHGIGIGHRDGTYSQYIQQLSDWSKEGNGLIYLGKTIKEDKNTMSMTNETKEFNTEEIPKLLIMFRNLLNQMTLKVEWKNMDNDTILEQQYQVPVPYSMNYRWWDTYYTYFIGPGDLEEGNYKVGITSIETTKGKRVRELSSTIEFLVA
jgi:hypothetical protein